ncbi:cyclic peptide export ABC transporter [Pseudoalteromonas citrea]|uniref:Cyclic peptide export ABC transporter n=1 Tax=Pseudoalteromonas citrea TaxID=43655 RepID=A0A5S3XJW5_9GAMM|nr:MULTISPECIES: cyclic peptide export ABC transporter [Pseudoalteromonas]RJE78367.1 cyclic peptide transporter [Pseudoalteromonas sp. MSK9-3]TMP47372.1 cyclic peptide export ABC transporter [Pseudoalteromonas citrea]TMP55004.1 cyclic peptide export ABC transporter [Pseudoalteromonas citrea]
MLGHLIKKTRWRFFATAASSVLFGLISVSLVALINEIINSESDQLDQKFIYFAILAISGVALQLFSKLIAEQLSEQSQAVIRSQVAELVISAKLESMERQGGAKIKSCLTEHSLKVATFFKSLPNILTNAMIVLGSLGYMAWLDWQVFLFALLTLFLGSAGYSLANAKAYKKVSEAARLQDELFVHFDAIVEGAKELKLNQSKRQVFLKEVLGQAIDKLKTRRVAGASIYHLAASWGGFSIFAFIGGTLYYLSGIESDSGKIMSGFALLFLYMLTPLEVMLEAIPRAFEAKASAKTIAEFQDDLEQIEQHSNQKITSFTQLHVKELSHSYYHEQSDEVFALSPINLTINAGELIYLVGGNGSGKTTFAKVFSGLYAANNGHITVDNTIIEAPSLDNYRQLFSTVFTDFYLFDRLLGVANQALEDKGNALIKKLNLHHKVAIKDGAFTTRDLSQGQRKRLALVVAYLEDRAFYLFDEWAADQDPLFKDVFYKELLPELTARGKTVLVITHDDKYFHLADRLLKMENGKLTEPSVMKNTQSIA